MSILRSFVRLFAFIIVFIHPISAMEFDADSMVSGISPQLLKRVQLKENNEFPHHKRPKHKDIVRPLKERQKASYKRKMNRYLKSIRNGSDNQERIQEIIKLAFLAIKQGRHLIPERQFLKESDTIKTYVLNALSYPEVTQKQKKKLKGYNEALRIMVIRSPGFAYYGRETPIA